MMTRRVNVADDEQSVARHIRQMRAERSADARSIISRHDRLQALREDDGDVAVQTIIDNKIWATTNGHVRSYR